MTDLSHFPYYVVVDGGDVEIIRCREKDRAIRIAERKHRATGEPHSVYLYQSSFNNRLVHEVPEMKP